MTDTPAKIPRKKYSKATIALSAPPRRAKVEIDKAREANANMQVSGPIAKQIEKLYHPKPKVRQYRRLSSDEKHPMLLPPRYGRGVSDSVAMDVVSSSKKDASSRPYNSVDGGGGGGGEDDGTVHLLMRNGEVMLFNDNLDAFEVHDLDASPVGNGDLMDISVNNSSLTLQNNDNDNLSLGVSNCDNVSLNDKMKSKESVDNENIKCSEEYLQSDESDKKSATYVNQVNKHNITDVIVRGKEYDNSLNTKKILNNRYHIENNMPGVIHADNSGIGNKENIVKQDGNNEVVFHEGDLRDEDRISASDEQPEQKNEDNKTSGGSSKKGKYMATGPAIRKIDKYRESLRRRKGENRSRSEPAIADQIFYQPDESSPSKVESKAEVGVRTPVKTSNSNASDNTPVTLRQRRYFSKSSDRPRSSLIIKATPVSRSNSLSSLLKINSLEDIPKGIAKTKIEEIKQREKEGSMHPSKRSRSPVWFSNPASPRLMSPTGSGASTPRYVALSPTPRYGALSPPPGSVSSLTSKYNTISAKASFTTSPIAASFSPISKQDAINILSSTLPRNFNSRIPKVDDRASHSSKQPPQNGSSSVQQYGEVGSVTYPKPAPRTRSNRNSLSKLSSSSNTSSVLISSEPNSINSQSSGSSSLYSTQSSGDDVSDKAYHSSSPITPKRPARGTKRSSATTPNVTEKAENDDSYKEGVVRTSKVPYTQVMPSRKKALVRMGVNSFRKKGPAPAPPYRNNNSQLQRQLSLEDEGESDKDIGLGGTSSSFTFVKGKSEPSNEDNDTDGEESSDGPNGILNVLGVTEDSSTDYEPIINYNGEQTLSYKNKESIYHEIGSFSQKIKQGRNVNDEDSFMLPAPIDFSDMDIANFMNKDPIYASVEKSNGNSTKMNAGNNSLQENKTKDKGLTQPVPPPRLKKSASCDMSKRISDLNGNSYRSIIKGKNDEDDSDDTLVHNEHSSTDYSSSEDNMLEGSYDPLYETISNMSARRRKVQQLLDTENNNNKENTNLESVNNVNDNAVKTGTESRDYSNLYIGQSHTYIQPITKKTPKRKEKLKEKKKNKKRAKSSSPCRVSEFTKTSSDEDLLDDRSRKRTMSPTSVAKDFKDTFKKMLRVRPGSPKEKGDKILTTSDNGNYSNSKKGILSQKSLSSITSSSPLPGESDGITLLRIKNNKHTYHVDFDSHSSQQPCLYCDKKDEHEHSDGSFDVHRNYIGRGNKKKPPLKRASKSMGDIQECMGVSDTIEEEVVDNTKENEKDMDTPSRHRRLPSTPAKHKGAVMVKVLGKDDNTGCQYTLCSQEGKQAVKICHHPECQDKNDNRPLMLCHACDKEIHSDPAFNTHIRFDILKKGGNLNRNESTRSLPGMSKSDDEGGGVEGEEEEANDDENDEKKNNKLRRKKVLKKRYHTDEPESKSAIMHVRSKSLQEQEFRNGRVNFKETPQNNFLNQSEKILHESNRRKYSKERSVNDTLISPQESQESVFENETSLTNENSDNRVRSQSNISFDNKNAESYSLPANEDEEDDDDEEEYSSILNSSLAVPAANNNNILKSEQHGGDPFLMLPNSDINDQGRSALTDNRFEKNNTQTSSNFPAGRDQVDSGKKMKSKIPHRKSKEDGSRKVAMGMEYFTLKFDLLGNPEVYEIVAAVKGVSLKDAVSSCLEKRGISVNSIDIFLASSHTPLPLQVECFPLGGSHLHVKAKEHGFSRSVSSQSLNKTAIKQPVVPRPSKLPPIYLRRDRHSRATLDPPVMHHRRLSQRAIKNETHPSMVADNTNNSLDHWITPITTPSGERESQKGKKGGSVSVDESSGGVSGVDISPHGTLTSSDTAKINKLKSTTSTGSKLGMLFSPFAKNQDKHEALLQQLDTYSHEGLPGMPVLLTMGKPEYDDQVFVIEKHWTDVVQIPKEELSKKMRDQQETIWELLYTEVEHIRKLKVVIDLYYCCLMDLQNETLLNDVRTEDVFSNIVEVCECNQVFWDTHLRQVLEHSRKTKKLLDPSLLKEGFMKFEEIFKPYAKYCLEQKACLDYIKGKQTENELFKTFLEWAEAQKQCNRLNLRDLIIIPMQRLTKYKLLLLAILKKTEKEEHRKDLIHMIEKVERFVLQVNQVMHQRAEHERLSMIIERIEAYDVTDAPNIEEVQKLASDFCKLDLTCPVPGCGPQQRRHLLLEGGMKFREANSRLDVYCFLFTDMLLVTKPNKRGDKVKVTKPPMRLDKCVVQLLRDGISFMLVYLNEYHVASGVYTFHGEAAKVWVDHVRRAQETYKQLRKQALEKTESRMYWEMFYEENYEDDLAVINNSRQGESSADRQDSNSSAETFMPNMDNIPRSNSHGQLRYEPIGQDAGASGNSRRLRISNSLDENSAAAQYYRDSTHAQHGPPRESAGGLVVQRSDSEPTRPPPLSLPKQSISDYNLSDYNDSPPALSRSSVQPDVYYGSKGGGVKSRSSATRTDSQSSGESQVVRPASRSKHQQQHRELPRRPDSAIVDGVDVHRSKLNQRRTRNEKRYHTADAIQELRKDNNRDTSIHKRLSWNLGTHTVDINIDDATRQGGFFRQGKTFSSDSIKSMPSSSGVSSTGSLHLSPESEICEEFEEEEFDDEDNLNYDKTRVDLVDSALINNHDSAYKSINSGNVNIPHHNRSNHHDYNTKHKLPPARPPPPRPQTNKKDHSNSRRNQNEYESSTNHSDSSSTNESSATLTAEQQQQQQTNSNSSNNIVGEITRDDGNVLLLDSASDSSSISSTGNGVGFGSGDSTGVINNSANSSSKSMPDISNINLKDTTTPDGKGHGRGGGSSAKKMSHRELLSMKNQLLLNSTLEASEV